MQDLYNSYGYLSCKNLAGETTFANSNFKNLFTCEHEIMGTHDSNLPAGPASCSKEFSEQDDYVAQNAAQINFLNIIQYPKKNIILHGIKAPIIKDNKVTGIMVHAYELNYQLLPTIIDSLIVNKNNHIYSTAKPNKNSNRILELSKRELECLTLIRMDLSTKKISEIMKISNWTVESYAKRIKDKLSCQTRVQMLEIANKQQIPLQLPQNLINDINASFWFKTIS